MSDVWNPLDFDFDLSNLFEVQRRAIEEADDKPGFAFFLEQGLGKTRTVLVEFHRKVQAGKADILAIVCPRTLRGAWRDEAAEIGLGYPVILHENEKKTRALLNEVRGRPLILVMHYEQVKTHGSAIVRAMLERRKRVYMALDESVRIKSPSSVNGEILCQLAHGYDKVEIPSKTGKGKKRHKLVAAQRAKLAYARVLSGTPAPQGAHDLWNQFRFVGGTRGQLYTAWRALYCKMGGFEQRQVLGYQNIDILRDRTGKYAFRAKKADWTDLPEKIPMALREIAMTKEQRLAYLSMMHDLVLEFSDIDYVSVEMAVTAKGKLQQISSGWIYDEQKQVREIVPLEQNPKLIEAQSILEDIETKSLAFYHFIPTRGYLNQMAEKTGKGYVFLESGLKDDEFDRRKRMFNEDDDIQWAFCQTDAVKEGHTLLGTKRNPCHNTLFVENSYSLYARAQAEDRNHRHGQLYPVNYWDIACSREDRAIIRALRKKADMQEAILSEFTAYRSGGLHFED